jgi:uncharacterized phage protein (TIGR02216 family)
MRFGLGRLRLSSRDFWALTPIELSAAARAFAPVGAEPLSRGEMARLMTAFPDTLPPSPWEKQERSS